MNRPLVTGWLRFDASGSMIGGHNCILLCFMSF